MKYSVGILSAAVLAGVLALTPAPASACNGNCDDAPGHNKDVHFAPGPIAGAGVPFLAVGYGVYWLIRRRRKAG